MRRLSMVPLGAMAVCLFAGVPLSAAQPKAAVALTQPLKTALIGDTVKFCVTFKNNVPNTTGFGPFVDLLFDAGGANVTKTNPIPSHLCDGVTFVGATVVSTNPPVPLTAVPVNNPPCAAGLSSIPHPYAAQGFPAVSSMNGQQLTTLPLPFGSYTQAQPEIRIEVTAQIDSFADHNHPLTVVVRGGFRWNGTTSLSTAIPPQTIIPRAIIIEKQFLGNDNEMVPGPSMPQQFAISVHVAPTPQPVTGLTINDCLPAGGQWIPSHVPCMTQNWPSLPGGSNTTITPTPTFIVTSLLTPPACAQPFNNTASITGGTWIPLDPADTAPSLVSSASANVTIRALAVQKSAQVLTGPQPLPGGQIKYHIDFESSDYLRFGNLVITDTLTDGQTYVTGSGTLTVSDRFGSLVAIPIAPLPVIHNVNNNYVCPPPKDPCHPPIGLGGGLVPNGNSYTFNVSQAMIQHLPAAPAPLNLGVLSGPASTSLPPNLTPAKGSIDFIVDITDAFSNQHGDDGKLSKDDPLYDDVQITGTQYSKLPPLAPTPIAGAICTDHGSSCMAVPSDVLHKEVFAVNGVPVTSNPLVPYPVKRADVVTFHMWKTIPSGDAEHLTVTDWFSQPVFDATTFSTNLTVCPTNVASLPSGTACYAAPSTVGTPGLTVSGPPDNSITFNFSTFNDPNNQPATIDLYASVTVSTNPFPDGLLQTNEAEECETNSYGTKFCQDAIAMVQLQEPNLLIRKRVYCAAGCNQPACVAGCPSPGVVTHATIGSLGSPSGNADANDVVTFVVSIENVGSGPNGAYDVQVSDNILPIPGTILPASFCVRRGNGAPPLLGGGTDYTASVGPTAWTLTLTNQLFGSIPSLNTTGTNIILIFFSVQLNGPSAVTVGGICPANTATLQHYSNMPGGQNFIGAAGLPVVLPATATICTQLNPVKQISSTSEPDPVNPNVTIGEIVVYRLSIDVPEGTVPPITISDTLPTNLQMQGTTATLATPGMAPQPPPLAALAGSVVNSGTPIHPVFQIPAFVNTQNNAACERLLLTFPALVMNTPTNVDGQTKVNTFSVQIGSQPPTTSSPVSVHIVEPKLTVSKDVVYGQTGVGHVALYTITIANNSNATAFDVTFKDTLPACVTLPTNPVLKPPVPAGVTLSGNFINGFSLSPGLKPGQAATITFQVSVPPTCIECTTLKNSVHVEWTSEPGPQGTGGTPGLSCAPNGERCGHGNPVNSYHADASASICGKVCGVKFADLIPTNGIQDPNEPGLAGWPINAGTVSTTTDASGNYCLELVPHLPAGPYTICEGTLPNWTPTTPTCVQAPVVANTTTTVNFGNRPLCSATLCGKKTTPPPASLPLGGWTITATGNGPVVTATTKPDGTYCMLLFGNGAYTITEQSKTGWLQTQPPSGSYVVKVTCPASVLGPGVITGVPDPNHVDFVNQNVCANFPCPLLSHCEVGPNKTPVCVSDINNPN